MKQYSIDGLTAEAYSSFPEAKRKPLIGLTGNHSDIDVNIRDAYHKQVVAAGGVPVIIPPVTDASVVINTLEHLDGLILTGGGDYNPLWCGEEPSPKLHGINAVRDSAELLITRLAFNRQIPMLGICRGMQTLAMALEGHVQQDISPTPTLPSREGEGSPTPTLPIREGEGSTKREGEADARTGEVCSLVKHSQDANRSEATHTIDIVEGSTLYNIYRKASSETCAESDAYSSSLPTGEGRGGASVNSFHHQAVDDPGKHFKAVAYAKDGVIEAMESSEEKSILGVQWHPEWLGEDGLPLFQWLVERAAEFNDAKRLHKRIVTLDTHCDTPMFFHQGVDFTKRDERIKVDLHKMTEGHQDATFMVCYLPQPTTETNGGPVSYKGKSFAELVHLDSFKGRNGDEDRKFDITPTAYCDFIFDEIGKIVEKKSDYVAFARTEQDLLRNKLAGKKSIVLAIENGLAIGSDIRNLQHFAERGITYMTLCHNGDNAICDSAKGAATHGGVSDFGEQVINEMNRLGIMVDLSHAAESSFYDALEISKTPIVCSHSNCRALCDHPRNLTDDQLRALAKAGGVAHTTFYPGFLRATDEATILDGIAHLEHAIDIMGIEHVGIGTDFDGDGGVPGMNDSSELINFTIQLLRRRYSEEDIRKIWGGNWLRTLALVQAQAK